jgi:hypothetical protein
MLTWPDATTGKLCWIAELPVRSLGIFSRIQMPRGQLNEANLL